MDASKVLPLVKARLGITSTVRDAYIEKIIEGADQELQDEQGVKLSDESPNHLMFLVDYAAWRYDSRGEAGGMPQDIYWRLRNLVISMGGNKAAPESSGDSDGG